MIKLPWKDPQEHRRCPADIQPNTEAVVTNLYEDVEWMYENEVSIRVHGKVFVEELVPNTGGTIFLVRSLTSGVEFHARYDEMRPLHN